MFRFLFIILIIANIGGCGTTIIKTDNRTQTIEQAVVVNLNNTNRVTKLLYDQFSHWEGTKYYFGGLSKEGIDCSGFVYITFKSQFGISLPRSTQLLSKIGVKTPKDKLRAGDLVFFETGKLTKHVGIYIENGKFLHVSTKKGVMISKLNNLYWNSKFWMAKRLN